MAWVLRAKIILAIAIAASSVAVWAAPAAAETVVSSCHGTCGTWAAYDDELANPGARCVDDRHGTAPFGIHLLNKIDARPPQMSGHYSTLTPVSWQFKIEKRRQMGGIENPTYHRSTLYTSPWQTSQASTTNAAYVGSGFTWRERSITQDPSWADYDAYRVIVLMRWSHHGSVEGRASFRYDWYRVKKGSEVATEMGWCGGAFPA